jgi:hypothetical protein
MINPRKSSTSFADREASSTASHSSAVVRPRLSLSCHRQGRGGWAPTFPNSSPSYRPLPYRTWIAKRRPLRQPVIFKEIYLRGHCLTPKSFRAAIQADADLSSCRDFAAGGGAGRRIDSSDPILERLQSPGERIADPVSMGSPGAANGADKGDFPFELKFVVADVMRLPAFGARSVCSDVGHTDGLLTGRTRGLTVTSNNPTFASGNRTLIGCGA